MQTLNKRDSISYIEKKIKDEELEDKLDDLDYMIYDRIEHWTWFDDVHFDLNVEEMITIIKYNKLKLS